MYNLGDALFLFPFNLVLDYVVREVAKSKVGLDLDGKRFQAVFR